MACITSLSIDSPSSIPEAGRGLIAGRKHSDETIQMRQLFRSGPSRHPQHSAIDQLLELIEEKNNHRLRYPETSHNNLVGEEQ